MILVEAFSRSVVLATLSKNVHHLFLSVTAEFPCDINLMLVTKHAVRGPPSRTVFRFVIYLFYFSQFQVWNLFEIWNKIKFKNLPIIVYVLKPGAVGGQ